MVPVLQFSIFLNKWFYEKKKIEFKKFCIIKPFFKKNVIDFLVIFCLGTNFRGCKIPVHRTKNYYRTVQ